MRPPRLLVVTLFAAAAAAAPAAADWQLFLPRALDNRVELELFASADDEEIEAERGDFGWSDRFLKERVSLLSDGFVYHPRFLRYHLQLGAAFGQERYTAESTSTGRREVQSDTSGIEYDVRAFLLPEHPYNLQLFALRYEPVFRERGAIRRHSLETSWGAEASYRRKPFLLSGRFSDEDTESSYGDTHVQRFAARGEYLRQLTDKREVSVSGAFEPSRFSTSRGLTGSAQKSWLSSFLDLATFQLRSRLADEALDQQSPASGELDSDRLTWEEDLTWHLPLGFRVDGLYRYYRDDTQSRRPGLPEVDFSSTRREVEGELSHRLYESLDTHYRYARSDTWSPGGAAVTDTHRLGLDYVKVIPRGRLTLGGDVGKSDTESEGQVGVGEESHPAFAVPGTFTLAAGNVDLATLEVFVRSPVAPFELLRLEETAHYRVASVGDRFEVTVFALPGGLEVPGSYDLRASFLTSGDFVLATTSADWYAGAWLFDDLLNPYYRHFELRSEVESGSFPGRGLNADTDVLGLAVQRRALGLRVEYQDVRWDTGPYVAWLGELRYNGRLGSATTLYATLSRLDRDYASTALVAARNDRLDSASFSLQQHFRRQRLVLSANGSYSRLVGFVDNESYSLGSSLTWHIGRLDLSSGYSLTRSTSDDGDADSRGHRSSTFYLRVRRTLF